MRELFAMWSNTRMVVLTAICAALYAAILIPFKVVPLIPGITEFRPANAVPVVCSFLFGPAAAWGSAFGNLIGDFFGGLGPGDFFGFWANFLYGVVPYLVWEAARRRARSGGDDRCGRGGGPDRERALARALGAVPHGDRRVRGWSRARAAPRAGDRGPGALVSDAAVAVRWLRCAYPGTARPALADLDLELAPSALAVVMGASGAGKSTLARCLTRLVPCFVPAEVTGDIRLLGEPIHVRP